MWHIWCNWLGIKLANETENGKDGKPLCIWKGIIEDETGSMEIKIFSSLTHFRQMLHLWINQAVGCY